MQNAYWTWLQCSNLELHDQHWWDDDDGRHLCQGAEPEPASDGHEF